MSTASPFAVAHRVCRCGSEFPDTRARQASYCSEACAERYRKADQRTKARIDADLDDAAAEATEARLSAFPASRPLCSHRGQQPFSDADQGGRVYCWRCGYRLSPLEVAQLEALNAARPSARALAA